MSRNKARDTLLAECHKKKHVRHDYTNDEKVISFYNLYPYLPTNTPMAGSTFFFFCFLILLVIRIYFIIYH